MLFNTFEYLIAVNGSLLDKKSAKNDTFPNSQTDQVSHTVE